ncbi:MAG: Ig-like domain-containing protein [Pseudomonadota bacterium]|nr:Ig-like domain-containing protein [Pseudomonadota bacterium]
MPTDVYFPLSSPSDSSHLSEHHPYGPLPAGVFNTDLGIEIQRSALSKYPLLAVVDGTVRLIPGPLSPVLVLGNVMGQAVQDLQSVVGESLVVFLYRNVDITSVADSEAVKRELVRWQSSTQNKGKKTLAETRNRFIEGKFQVEVKAGDALGFVASTGEGKPHLGFEVLYTPSGLVGEPGWLRLTEIFDPANKATRRLDPTSFYHRVASGPTATIRVKLPSSQVPHGLLPKLTKRILLELRDEYDLPFQGTVTVAEMVSATAYVLRTPDRGTVALPTPTPGDRTVSITNRVLTELPSGSSSSRTPRKLLSAPAHWSLQSIFMAQVFSQEHWFAHNESHLPLFTEGNRVTPLVDGKAAFKEMVQAMGKVRGSTDKHFLRLAGWWLSDHFEMIPGQAGSTFAKLTEDIVRGGADVHALVWKVPSPSLMHYRHNSAAVNRINKLKQGSRRKGFAIFDSANVGVGSHHQKLMIASAGNDLAVGFCGGIDINPNRLDTPFHTIEAPYHDLHAKVEGPAVTDLNATFVLRWNFNSEVLPTGSLPRIDPSVTPATKSVGSQFVQVTRTYPWHCSYPFAPLGETGTLLTLRRAIQRARRFIYFEDQYATPYAEGRADGSGDTLGILTDLLAAVHRIEYLIIVLPNYAGQPNGRQFRYRFIRVLQAEAKKPGVKAKVLVFYLRRDSRAPKVKGARLEDVESEFALMTQGMAPGIVPKLEHSGDSSHPEEIFLHSKVWLIDDVYAKIGSANVNRRSLTHDSELDIHVIDGAITRGARRFARELRLQLWGEMLNARPDYLNIQLEDPSYALQFWLNPPRGSFVVPYDAAAGGGKGKLLPDEATGQGLWHSVVDPDGHVGGVCLRRGFRHAGEGGLPGDFGAESDLKSELSSDFGERVLAHPGEPDEMHDRGFGKSLVYSTDQAIASGKLRCSAELLRHLLSEAHLLESRISTEVWDQRAFSAADLFDAFTSGRRSMLRDHLNNHFEVVALPGTRISNELCRGDISARRALGEGRLAHLAVLGTGEVFQAEALPAAGLRPESRRPGLFAQVVDSGPFPHCLENRFARRMGDEHGWLDYDSLLLRLRYPGQRVEGITSRDATGVELLEQVSLSLTGPTPIERATQGNYEVTNAPQGATFSNWRFVGRGVAIQRPGNNDVANWQGTMVQGGTIRVDVTVGGAVQTLSLAVAITPRPWTENAPPIPLPRAGHGNLPVQPRLNRPGHDPRDPGLGVSDARESHTIQTRIVGGGPNEGFNFLDAAPLTWTPQAFSNEALYDPTHPFFRAHDASRRGLPLPGGRPQIGQIQVNVEAHEGIIAAPPRAPAGYASHWGLLLNHLAVPANQINIPLERDVSHRSNETNAQYGARLQRFLTARVTAAQNASRPHAPDIFRGTPYFNYPYIDPRTLRLRINGAPVRLTLSNPRGGRTVWASDNPAVATVNAGGVVSPVAQGRTTIRVTNADGDIDEISLEVVP